MPVLITGESGTGKNVVAQNLHMLSTRRDRAFVQVNCPSLPHSLIESELFGYEAGAFTGANHTRSGKVDQAQNGTLFLDEIGDLDASVQAKLLQVLQDFRFSRLGGTEERAVDIWLICATHRNLQADIKAGRFRSDLFYRINVVSIELPPLRDHRSDVVLLLTHFLRHYELKFGRTLAPLSSSVLKLLEAYHWPGNVRELENLVKRYVVLGNEQAIVEALNESESASTESVFRSRWKSSAAHPDAARGAADGASDHSARVERASLESSQNGAIAGYQLSGAALQDQGRRLTPAASGTF